MQTRTHTHSISVITEHLMDIQPSQWPLNATSVMYTHSHTRTRADTLFSPSLKLISFSVSTIYHSSSSISLPLHLRFFLCFYFVRLKRNNKTLLLNKFFSFCFCQSTTSQLDFLQHISSLYFPPSSTSSSSLSLSVCHHIPKPPSSAINLLSSVRRG